MKRTDILDTKSAREAIEILVADLRKYAEWEFSLTDTPESEELKLNRKQALLFAAGYIEKAL
jgi:hypothetical protein